MHVETRVTLWCFLKQKNEICEHFFCHFFRPFLRAPKVLKLSSQIFFSMSWPSNMGL